MFGQWSYPNSTNIQTWDNVAIKGASTRLTFSNDAETESGIYFKDTQGAATQHSEILYDAAYENLNFYVHGSNSTSSAVLMSMTPNRKVLFNGTVVAKEIFVQTNVWADYVFANEYKLKPLYELEEFINKNKHLPGVPSEEEVLEKGVNVSEMNVVLMEKVEELTLYVIQLKKEIDELKNK